MNKKYGGKNKKKEEAGISNASQRPTLKVNWPVYEEYLRDPELSESQKREFLEALWSIMVSFVDLGFGIEPVQQVLEDKTRSDSGRRESRSGSMSLEPMREGAE